MTFHFIRSITYPLLVHLLFIGSGCAVHYFDAKSGAEHIWGIGHMVMKPGAPHEGLRAIGRRTDTVGISGGKLQEGLHFELGWGSRQRIEIVDENTQLCLAWPRGAFYNARVGSTSPPELGNCTHLQKEKTQ